MHYEDDFEVRRNANGDPDVGYYIDTAHQLRSAMLRQLVAQATAGLARQAQQLSDALHLGGHQPSLRH